MKKSVRTVLLLFFTAMLVFSAWQLLSIYGSYREGQKGYSDLDQYVSFQGAAEPGVPKEPAPKVDPEGAGAAEPDMPKETVPGEPSPEIDPESTETPDLSVWPQVDFERLSQINPDIVGWICIEGTNINYPVVQGSDNDYYLRHLFDGTYNAAGCIFLDVGCAPDFSDRHSILYGHHMKDKSMFHGLMGYKKQSFYDEHAVALFVTPAACYKIRFFSGYVAHTSDNAWDLSFDDPEYALWLEEVKSKSCFKSDYVPSVDDRVITLSTCTYEFDSARFVVHGYISEEIVPESD